MSEAGSCCAIEGGRDISNKDDGGRGKKQGKARTK